jgi:hypothetical protein
MASQSLSCADNDSCAENGRSRKRMRPSRKNEWGLGALEPVLKRHHQRHVALNLDQGRSFDDFYLTMGLRKIKTLMTFARCRDDGFRQVSTVE